MCNVCDYVWVPGKVSLICCVMSEVLLLRGRGLSPSPISHSDSWHSSTSSGQTHTVSNTSPDTITMLIRDHKNSFFLFSIFILSMHAENLTINCSSIINCTFATSSSEDTNGKHLLHSHDYREWSKRGCTVLLAPLYYLQLSIWFVRVLISKVCMLLQTHSS